MPDAFQFDLWQRQAQELIMMQLPLSWQETVATDCPDEQVLCRLR